MNNSYKAAGEGAIIGFILYLICSWIMRNLALVLGVVLALPLMGWIAGIAFNDTTNASERRDIAQKHVWVTQYDQQGRHMLNVINGSRFMLTNITLSCDGKSATVPNIAPHTYVIPTLEVDRQASCQVIYDPVEVTSHRENGWLVSEK